jgi:hypothetical protein
MVRRTAAAALTGAALAFCAATAAAVARNPGPALRPGDVLPVGQAAPRGDGVVLAWVFRSQDYLTCAAPAAELRRVQRAFGADVRIVAVAVGSEHRDWLPAFFRRERVDVRPVFLEEDEYHARFGGSPLPAMYLLRDGRIDRIIFAGEAQSRSPRRLKAIGPMVRAALPRPGLEGEAEGP